MGILIRHHHTHSLDEATRAHFRRLTESIAELADQIITLRALTNAIEELRETIAQVSRPDPILIIVSGQSIHVPGLRDFQGEDMSYTVPRDHQDEPLQVDPVSISDSEGAIDIPFTESLESDNPDVVSVVDGPAVHFGTFGNATVSRKVTLIPPGQTEPATFNAGSAVFNVTPGAISVTGNISVPGLTPDPEPPAPEG